MLVSKASCPVGVPPRTDIMNGRSRMDEPARLVYLPWKTLQIVLTNIPQTQAKLLVLPVPSSVSVV